MGTTKSEIYTEQQNELAAMTKAIGHPARIAILQYLFKTNACVCSDLTKELDLARATVFQHLKELRNSGLIQGTAKGNSVFYCIAPKAWSEYQQVLTTFLGGVPLNKNFK